MKNSLLDLKTLIMCAGLLFAQAASAAVVTITADVSSAQVQLSDSLAVVSQYTNTTALPTSTSVTATSGNSTATLTHAFSVSGGQTSLSTQITGSRATNGVFINGTTGVRFVVDVDTLYAISGQAAFVDAGVAGYSILDAFLVDLTMNVFLLSHQQASGNTLNESLTLGGAGGDSNNSLDGSLTGTLLAGHEYMWVLTGATQLFSGGDEGSTVSAAATLLIGEAVTAVPEPSTGLLVIAALGALLAGRRRQAAR